MHIIPPIDKIIVTIDRSQEEEIKMAGGMKLYLATRLNIQEHVTVKGICVGVPEYLKHPELQNIEPLVKIGDEVYFSYLAVFDQELNYDEQYHHNELKIGQESYWLVDYLYVFFVKRGDEIVMVGSHVLVEPVYEDKDFGFLSVPDTAKNIKRKDKGKVVSIGVPNKGEHSTGVKSGDIIAFDERYVERYNFWDKPYYITKQDRILHKCR